MTAPVNHCPDCGFSSGERCDCGRVGERVLDGRRRERLSKFLSGLLRHFPGDYGVELDAAGWADRETVERVVAERYDWADARSLEAVVVTDPKGRFETREGEIRAAYGHSVDVDPGALDGDDREVPATLYHGTAPGNVESILEEGLRPMGRREVHLSPDAPTAREVGRRHLDTDRGVAPILAVDAERMRADGHRISKRGPETYTADRVPPAYLSVVKV